MIKVTEEERERERGRERERHDDRGHREGGERKREA